MTDKVNTKEQMSTLLTGIQGHLSPYTGQFPGLVPVVLAMTEAIKDPLTNPTGVGKQTKKERPIKPVTIDYQGKDILVKTPWGQAGRALAHAFKVIVGKRSKSVNPETGEPYFLTAFDKKVKAHRIPKEKSAEVMAAIKESGLPVEDALAAILAKSG
jgi:hypothetical protein